MPKQANTYWISPSICSMDMTVPTLVCYGIWGALLVAAIAFCGGLDATSTTNHISLESQVVNDENVIGYNPNDPVTSCGRERGLVGQRCRGNTGVISASPVH